MVSAVIVAAGSGTRMQAALRKQYLPLAGLPILTRTLTVFENCEQIDQICLVIPGEDFNFCRRNILMPAKFNTQIKLIAGGQSRQESVYNGLQKVEGRCSIVVIHDGVRPLIRNDQLVACIKGAGQTGACILAVPAFDTLKQADASGRILSTLKRGDIWLAQTPQAFDLELIKKAHEFARREGNTGTDDASLVEYLGAPVTIVTGSRSNIKITSSEDLQIAKCLLREAMEEAAQDSLNIKTRRSSHAARRQPPE